MEVLELRSLPGPNLYSRAPTILLVVDLGKWAGHPTAGAFSERLLKLLPGLADHPCEQAAGFRGSLESGTTLAHAVEHVAVELQRRCGIEVATGTTVARGAAAYAVTFPYVEAQAGIEAARRAVDIVEDLALGVDPDLDGSLEEVAYMLSRSQLGPTTRSLVEEAQRRRIPYLRLDEASFIQFGHGRKRQLMQASLTGQTSCLGAEVADDKERTKEMLHAAGVPVPVGEDVRTVEEAKRAAERIGFPVVLKPLVGNHGRGISTDLNTPEEVAEAFNVARQVHRVVVVEKHIRGDDHRVLIINHKFVAAARRDPAHVIGDGTKTVQELLEAVNADPRRSDGHASLLTTINVDEQTMHVLAKQGMTLASVPEPGQRVLLKGPANISSGGTATDVTDEVHPEVRKVCERASRVIGLDIMGLDIVAPTLAEPLEDSGGAVVEANAAPGLRMHIQPSHGKSRDVTTPIFDMLFPDGSDGRIPIVAVTGTNGKTTTVRLLAHMLSSTGMHVGLSTTTGVEVDGSVVRRGDYSGPEGAHIVLKDPIVDAAVLEVARGGILRRGLGFDECHVGMLLNVSADHLGEGGIETVEDLARVKSVVVQNVRKDGTAVLNADDALVAAVAKRLDCNVTFFSLDCASNLVAEHVGSGGKAVTVDNGCIVLRDASGTTPVVEVTNVPIALGGAAWFNVANALAATAAASALGLTIEQIREGLTTFRPSPEHLPGRLNVLEFPKFQVIVDYGHNVAAVQALSSVVRDLPAKRRITVASASGNRRDEAIQDFGRQLAEVYDHLILCDPDPRGREPGETMRLVAEGAASAGMAPSEIEYVADEKDAIRRGLLVAQEGDLLVVQADDVRGALRLLGHGKDPVSRPPRPSPAQGRESKPAATATPEANTNPDVQV